MRTFRVYFDIPHSSFSIHKPYSSEVGTMRFTLRLPDGDSILQIHDRRKTLDEQIVHDGLLAQVDLPSSNIDAACKVATSPRAPAQATT